MYKASLLDQWGSGGEQKPQRPKKRFVFQPRLVIAGLVSVAIVLLVYFLLKGHLGI